MAFVELDVKAAGGVVTVESQEGESVESAKDICLEKMRVVISTYLGLKLEDEIASGPDVQVLEAFVDRLIVEIRYEILSRDRDDLHYIWPADWWQAVKARFAPGWFVRRWPVIYEHRHIKVKEYYPSVALPDRDPCVAAFDIQPKATCWIV